MYLEVIKGAAVAFLYVLSIGDFRASKPNFDPVAEVSLHIRFGDEGFHFPDLVEATQQQIDSELHDVGIHNWTLKLIDELEKSREIHRHINSLRQDPVVEEEPLLNDVNLFLLFRSADNSVGIDPEFKRGYLFYTLSSVHLNDLPFFLAQAIIYHMFKPEISMFVDGCAGVTDVRNKEISVIFNNVAHNGTNKEQYNSNFNESYNDVFHPFQQDFSMYRPINLDFKGIDYLDTKSTSTDRMAIECSYTTESTLQSENILYLSTKDDYYNFMGSCIRKIEHVLGFPGHPDNNLPFRIQMVKHCLSVLHGDTVEGNDFTIHTKNGTSKNMGCYIYERKVGKSVRKSYWLAMGIILAV